MKKEQKIVRINSNSRSYPGYLRENVVRQEALPVRETPRKTRRESEQERIQRQRRKRWERNVRKRAIERGIKARYAKANGLSFTEVAIVCLLAGILLVSCAFFVYQEAAASASMKRYNTLQSAYEELVEKNKTLEGSIGLSIDIDRIYQYATDELGMSYPKKHQIITYKHVEDGYVRQGEDIPKAE